ncbi:MAG: hypothetical protein KF724_13800 [Phycisphaeraceae bacterium]|nr:hypothetical protein [Phycisphaeraceae bacterium]
MRAMQVESTVRGGAGVRLVAVHGSANGASSGAGFGVGLGPRPRTAGWRRATRMALAIGMVVGFAGACGPKTNVLEDGSRAPRGPRVAAGAEFSPRVGDFATIERFLIVQGAMSEASGAIVSTVVPRIRERGGLRDVWVLRNDGAQQIDIVSIWSDPVAFQVWQMSSDRIEAYRSLGPVLSAQPIAETVSLIGLIDRANRR